MTRPSAARSTNGSRGAGCITCWRANSRTTLLREFARAGHGFAPVPAVQEDQFRRQFGLVRVGLAQEVRAEFFAISLERSIRHPAVAAIVSGSRQMFTGR
jgi:LysR family transcriptional activator of nhaA